MDTYEQWFYRNQGDVPTNWYDSNTSGWSTGSRDNFGQFTKRVELYKKTFTLSTLEDISGFTVSIRYRYGVAVYVNSVEVFKNGITTVSDTAVVDNIYPSLTFHTVSLPLKTMAMDGTPPLPRTFSLEPTRSLSLWWRMETLLVTRPSMLRSLCSAVRSIPACSTTPL